MHAVNAANAVCMSPNVRLYSNIIPISIATIGNIGLVSVILV